MMFDTTLTAGGPLDARVALDGSSWTVATGSSKADATRSGPSGMTADAAPSFAPSAAASGLGGMASSPLLMAALAFGAVVLLKRSKKG